MKAPPFDYACPRSLSEAIGLLAAANGEARIIAGGQSLLPLLAFRLASPSLLVDIRKVPDLRAVRAGSDGVVLGARVTWSDIESSADIKRWHPLLHSAVAHVAHYQIRNRGTVGGSLAHADPAAELLGVAVACGAEIETSGSSGRRFIKIDDFLLDALSTCLGPDEIIVSVALPPWLPRRRWAFEEFSRRAGDFALAGVAIHYDVDEFDRVRDARIAVIGACNRSHRLREAEAFLNGKVAGEQVAAEAAKIGSNVIEPPSDIHAPAEYRRALLAALIERGLSQAATRLPLGA